MLDLTAIATAHQIDAGQLAQTITAHGWDFSRLDENDPAHVDFATRVADDKARQIAEGIAKRVAAEARAVEHRQAAMTPQAKAHPELICGRCDGKGHIRGFGHIANGTCFACSGVGIIRRGSRP